MAVHPIVHVDIATTDRQASIKFYQSVFGWEVRDMPDWNYATFSPGEGHPGGGFESNPETTPAKSTLVYIDCDDIDATLKQIEATGGKALSGKHEVTGMGWWAKFSDPCGTVMALWQPAMSSKA